MSGLVKTLFTESAQQTLAVNISILGIVILIFTLSYFIPSFLGATARSLKDKFGILDILLLAYI